MRKLLTFAITAFMAVLAACSDGSSTSPDLPTPREPRANVALPQCERLTTTQAQTLVTTVYNYVNLDPAVGLIRWSKISAGDKAEAWVMTKEILDRKQLGGLASTTDMTRLINFAFCTVGISVGFPGGDGWVVLPNPNTTVNLVTSDQQAAFVLPPNSITDTSLLAITPTTDTLRTNLDKYPIVRNFSKYPKNTFAVPAGVYICASVPLSNPNYQAILNRMRLGHNIGSTGFEILPYAQSGIPLLNCDENILAGAPPSIFDRALDAVLPKYLWAQKYITRGCSGVGGNVSELSPIGPVDPQIIPVATSSLSQSAQAGTDVPSTPAVQLITANGTKLRNIPVTFSVTSGGGTIIPTTPVLTSTLGIASSTAWSLGLTAGTNTASATPANGGDAVVGTFFQPANISFTANGQAVTYGAVAKITMTGGPAANTAYVAGTTLPLLTATVRDANNNVVTNYTGTITAAGSVTGSLVGTLSLTASKGVARFSNLQVTKIGSQTVTVRTVVSKKTYSVISPKFSVSAAAPTTLALIAGNNTSAAVGVSPTTKPSVQVRDAFGNIVPNTTVYFGPSNNGSGITPASAVSASTGNATVTAWPLQHGTNNLMASLDSPVSPSVASRRLEFTATGTSTATAIANCTTQGTVKSSIRSYSAVWKPTSTQLGRPINNVKFYLSTGNGAATPYRLNVRARVFSSTGATLVDRTSITSTAVLYGTTTENKQVNFAFSTAIPLTSASYVLFTISDVNNPTGSAVNLNLGSGSACGGTTIVGTSTPTTTYRTGSAMVVMVQ